jgi:hydrogenase maturation protease
MTPVRIVGIGSDRAGDRVGWEALTRLQHAGFEACFEPGLVSLQTCRFPAQLLQLLEGCRLAVLIDAVQAEPGALLCVDVNDLVTCKALHSSHGVGVGEALQLVERLFEQPPDVRVLGIGVGDGEAVAIDAAMRVVMPALTDRLDAEIQRFTADIQEPMTHFLQHWKAVTSVR